MKCLQRNLLTGVAIPLGLTVSALNAMAWAETNYALQSIDFLSKGNTTEIQLHTGSIVPYNTVLSSDNKLVLDIDRVTSDRTVRTNFAGARNVSHVIIQPLSESRMRLIVRGENLGNATVKFKDAQNEFEDGGENVDNLYAQSETAFEESAAQTKHKIAAKKQKAEALRKAAEEAKVLVANAEPTESVDAIRSTEADESFSEGVSDEDATLFGPGLEKRKAKASKKMDEPAPEPLPPLTGKNALGKSAMASSMLQHADAPKAADWTDFLTRMDLDWLIKLGLLGGLVIGLGVFIRLKLQSLSQTQYGPAIGETADKRAKFRDLASAYQNPGTGNNGTPSARKRAPGGDAPIGLGSLKNTYADDEPQAPRAAASATRPRSAALPPIIEEPLRKRPQSPPPPRQAVNQYAKQAAPIPPKGRPAINDDILQREVRRSAESKRQSDFVKPQMPSKQGKTYVPPSLPPLPTTPRRPTPSAPSRAKTGLPANPEVLDFLRSVADMMEKDGDTGRARSIQKNIRPT